MPKQDSTEVLYNMFERRLTDEQIQRLTGYRIEFIKHIRYLYKRGKNE